MAYGVNGGCLTLRQYNYDEASFDLHQLFPVNKSTLST